MWVGARSPWAGAFLIAAGTLTTACATVPQNRREYLSDPTMAVVDDPLEAKAMRKLQNTREGAAGGDTESAGGGCGCGN
jgi:hypothetical protein